MGDYKSRDEKSLKKYILMYGIETNHDKTVTKP